MKKLTVLKIGRASGKTFSQLAFLVNEMSFDYRMKRELLQLIEKFGLVKTEILYKLKGEN
ncbi:hypothetical protein P9D34_05920 [Bacillus swezeyi]|uniref:Uncharacterized protein n=1 Tax=Bacillus swezeyi TaxID=1925020 RepID=A0A1R1Q729_9BACI|nr:hypothetical protein [Bacillus swezeyi]MEC1259990.1 hypothetical protein [Bacillus swezeyi]MED2929778.1 hypothetical protein [Bacillus swezeyi]MED2963195.1 hypothetical protein [Bacillus swezeyi]MED2979762.1 hypothetical protein [Bacillus swezeyi]MED3073146.1 hypothetical protein [Bacillus swezeyi]